MVECTLVNKLDRLKRSSIYSVDNASKPKKDDNYFHVYRHIEEKLRSLLREVNKSGTKHLVLLCGSAGDGKSHLLSYLKYSDAQDEHLLDDFDQIYNDASISDEPNMTAMETLAGALEEFDDDHYLNNDGYKMIIAINLGLLSNFIESDDAKNYTKLKEYVETNGIISELSTANGYKPDSVFQHISFSDYHMFTLTENGAQYEYIDQLIEKVVGENSDSPFDQAFKQCAYCNYHVLCPIKDNYLFLRNKVYQDAIEYCLLEVEFKDKHILSTRDILDFIYRIIVPPNYEDKLSETKNEYSEKRIRNYLESTTPNLLFDGDGASAISDIIQKYDPLKHRNQLIDKDAIIIHSNENIKEEYLKVTDGTNYSSLAEQIDLDLVDSKADLKQQVFNFLVRLKTIKNDSFRKDETDDFERFIKYLYYQNSGQEKKLSNLYKVTEQAVMQWNGQFRDELVSIGNYSNNYWILENLKLDPAIKSLSNNDPKTSLDRYSPTLKIRFKKTNNNSSDSSNDEELSMDYSLFSLMLNMNKGYYPTAHDKNIHANFDKFVNELTKLGNESKKIIIEEKKSDDEIHKAVFEHNEFGYSFKVDDE